MKYKEFLRLVLPTQPALRSLAVHKEPYSLLNDEVLPLSVEKGLFRLFYIQLEGHNKQVKEMQKLFKCKDFNLLDAFHALYLPSEVAITTKSLSNYLKATKCITRINDAELFIRRFDLDNDGVLSYEEFQRGFLEASLVEELTPKKKYPNKKKVASKKTIEYPKQIAEECIIKALEEQIEKYRGLESIKVELIEESDYNLVDAFKSLFDTSCKGNVTLQEFYEVLETLGVTSKCPSSEIKNLLEKYCTESSGVITYANFCEIMMPHDRDLAQILYSRPSYNLNKPFTLSGKIRVLLKLFFTLFCQLAKEYEETARFFKELAYYMNETMKDRISACSLKKLLDKHKIITNDSELIGLFEKYYKLTIQ